MNKTCLLIGIIIILTCLFLTACLESKLKIIERYFPTIDLLISISDMPPGWRINGEPEYFQDIGVIDAVVTGFKANTSSPYNEAGQRIYRYLDTEAAKEIYKIHFIPMAIGEKTKLKYSSSVAEQETVACYDWEGRQPTNCEWVAQYEEYIVWFQTWLIPEYMSLDDMAKVVQAIDKKMTDNLLNKNSNKTK